MTDRRVMRAMLAAYLLVTGLLTNGVWAQQPNPRRRLVEDLLKTFVDSQLNRAVRPNPGTAVAPTSPAADPNFRRASQIVGQLAASATSLVQVLYTEARRSPELHSLLNDAFQIRADTAVLAGQVSSRQIADIATLKNEYRHIDRDWRILHARLMNSYGLSANARTEVQRLHTLDEQLGTLLEVQPQLDRTELIRMATAASSSIRNLVDDLRLELPPSARRQRLERDGRTVQQQSEYLSRLIEQGHSREIIVREYEQLRRLWLLFSAEIRPLRNRHLDHDVRRIDALDQSAQRLLWLNDAPQDHQVLGHAVELTHYGNRLLEDITLAQLLNTDRGTEIVKRAGDFRQKCQSMVDRFDGDVRRAELVNTYRDIHRSWTALDTSFQWLSPAPSSELREETRDAVSSLALAIGVEPIGDRSRAIEVAASLENLASHYRQDAQQVGLASRGYTRAFQAEVARTTNEFANLARDFHRRLANRRNVDPNRDASLNLGRKWQELTQQLNRFRATDRAHLSTIAQQITLTLLELQTRLGL